MPADRRAALAEARSCPFWLDSADRPAPHESLVGRVSCDLAVVGGGFTGLWTALLAKERDPAVDVVLLESREIGWAASGRNGGFCDASLTHGVANGRARFPDEIHRLEQLGLENLDAIEATVRRYGIDCGFERTGILAVAVDRWQLDALRDEAEIARSCGHDVALLDREHVRAQVDSPTYLGGLWTKNRTALVDPAKLAWGLKAACLARGVRIFEGTVVLALDDDNARVGLTTPHGRVHARRVALGAGAFPPLLRRVRPYIVPIYDYVLVTEPLSDAQLATIGWRGRQGLSDGGNQFHYYRLTRDNRVLWGGYDAIYHYGNGLRDELDQRPETFAKLAGHFLTAFPQLEGVRFTHAWGGAIDLCSRFSAFWGTAMAGCVVYVAGYTGLGVGATRFGAAVMLDLLSGQRTGPSALRFVQSRPVPFPPEPLKFPVIQLTRWSLGQADRNGGRRNTWLRTLDRLGLGFDS